MALTRRSFIGTSTAALAAGTLGRYVWPGLTLTAQGPFDVAQGRQGQRQPPTPVVTELRRNVGTFTAQGGTIGWLVNAGGAIAVDSQFPATAPMAVDELLKRSNTSEIAMLINTHHHGDHTGGNGVFRPKTKTIVGHENVPKYMRSGVPPDKTVGERWSTAFGDEQITTRHYGPAHTGGDIVIVFEKANVAHMGDLMFNRAHPVIDRTNGASIANWSQALRKAASDLSADTIYIYGHAGNNFPVTGSRTDLLHHANYLEALLEYVRAQVKAGRTRDEVVALRETIKGFEDYGPLIARPLGPAYDEIQER